MENNTGRPTRLALRGRNYTDLEKRANFVFGTISPASMNEAALWWDGIIDGEDMGEPTRATIGLTSANINGGAL
jgi:hypothetical protein